MLCTFSNNVSIDLLPMICTTTNVHPSLWYILHSELYVYHISPCSHLLIQTTEFTILHKTMPMSQRGERNMERLIACLRANGMRESLEGELDRKMYGHILSTYFVFTPNALSRGACTSNFYFLNTVFRFLRLLVISPYPFPTFFHTLYYRLGTRVHVFEAFRRLTCV